MQDHQQYVFSLESRQYAPVSTSVLFAWRTTSLCKTVIGVVDHLKFLSVGMIDDGLQICSKKELG